MQTPGKRAVTLVCGPPAAGKSTWVNAHLQPGDLVVCHDQLAQQAGSPHPHDHSWLHGQDARYAWAALVDDVAAAPTIRAWVIRCAAIRGHRESLAERLQARVIVINPGIAETMRRATQDGRSPRVYRDIERWFAEYTPSPLDVVVDT